MISGITARPRNYKPPSGRLERFLCAKLFRLMLNPGRIRIDFGDAPSTNGQVDVDFVVAPPRLLTVLRLLTRPDFWVGETFIAGRWYLVKGNLADFLDAIEQEAKGLYSAYYYFLSSFRGIRYYLRQYVLNKHFTRQVRRHYEIDSKIYEMILDKEMLYTCAFFISKAETLESAQQNKLATTIERMSIPSEPAQILDIGCGWGGMARAIVRKYEKAEVCGLSISASQVNWAKSKDRETLSPNQIDRINYRLEDYVDHERYGFYDAISIIGMIEHVGLGGYSEFFRKIHGFLKSGGTAVIHTIVSPRPAVPTNSWIDQHIFTGGYAPSISELVTAAERLPFRISGLYVHEPLHYRRTIECWLSNFTMNLASIHEYLQSIKFSEAEIDVFVRTWLFYLSGVRNMFVGDRPRSHQIVQLALQKL